MASTYSTNLRLELIGTGEQQGTWGTTTNVNLGTLLEEAIGGYTAVAVTDGADTTLTTANGSADQSRNMTLNLTGALTAARNVICPAIEKVYIVKNSTTGGFAVTVKVSGQTGVSIPNGTIAILYVDGTDARAAAGTLTSGGTGAASAPAAMANLTGFTTTATAAGTTTLTSESSCYQVFTGATTQTIVLPVTTTLVQGWTYKICNNSTGNLTVNSSGSNLVQTIIPGVTATIRCILASGTTAASWESGITDFSTYTGTGSVVLSAGPALTGDPTVSGTLVMGSSFLRNRIINGDMRIDQRNAGASVTPTSGSYTLDRWNCSLTQASKVSVQQSTTAPAGHNNSLLVTVLAAVSVAAGDTFEFQQGIEGFNVADLGFGTASAKTVTLSFWVRSSLTGTFGGSINGNNSRSYPFSYTISAANTWEQKTVTIPGDTTGTYNTTNGVGFIVMFGLGSGSTFTGTSGAWAAGNLVQPTGTVSVVGTLSATWYVTGVQLEAGSVATPFERRQYGQELALAQRYYEVSTLLFSGNVTTANSYYCMTKFSVTKRAAPTIVLTASGGVGGFANVAGTAGADATFVQEVRTSTATGVGVYGSTFTASAEL